MILLIMDTLSERQTQILKVLIEEYIDTAEPVGSVTLEKKYDLGVSPATIRNETAALDAAGYLKQPHTSAGRIPTSKALQLYVKELMQTQDMSVADEISIKEKIWDSRNQSDKMLRNLTRALAAATNTLSVIAVEDGNLYYSGAGNVLNMPEFYDIDITRNLLLMLDEFERWDDVFSQMGEEGTRIFIGPELKDEIFNPYSFIFAPVQLSQGRKIYIGVVGPRRLQYRKLVPTVDYCARLLGEVASW